MKLIKFTTAALFTLSSLTAQAGLIKIDGGTELSIPSNNDFSSYIAATEYTLGGNLQTNQAGPLSLTFNFLATEAGWLNTFESEGNIINNTTSKTPFSYTKSYADSEDISFSFYTLGLNPLWNFVLNGSNSLGDGVVSFAVALDTTYKGIQYDAILFFDDTGGFNDDDNHDDLLIGVKAATVPESSAFVLMLLGLASLVGARRRKFN